MQAPFSSMFPDIGVDHNLAGYLNNIENYHGALNLYSD
jgi:hypothetical protein